MRKFELHIHTLCCGCRCFMAVICLRSYGSRYKFVLKMIVKLKHDFINVSWVKEVTAAAINKSNWINWIKLLLLFFCLGILHHYHFNWYKLYERLQKTVPKGKNDGMIAANTAATIRNFQIKIFISFDLSVFVSRFFLLPSLRFNSILHNPTDVIYMSL